MKLHVNAGAGAQKTVIASTLNNASVDAEKGASVPIDAESCAIQLK